MVSFLLFRIVQMGGTEVVGAKAKSVEKLAAVQYSKKICQQRRIRRRILLTLMECEVKSTTIQNSSTSNRVILKLNKDNHLEVLTLMSILTIILR